MSMDYKPVSLEEYNQSLRDTVNAYYTHAMNDPTMSNESALKSTGEVAENYLQAVDEFQEAQNCSIENENSEMTDEDVSIESDGSGGGEDCEDGLDL